MWHHGYGMSNGLGGGALVMGVVLLFWLLVVVSIVVLIVWAVRRSTGQSSGPSHHEPDALEIARRRYAKGEITKEQFEQFRQDLGE